MTIAPGERCGPIASAALCSARRSTEPSGADGEGTHREHEVSAGDGLGQFRRETEIVFDAQVTVERRVHALFIERHVAVTKRSNLGLVDVEDRDLVPEFRHTHACRQPDITGTDNGDLKRIVQQSGVPFRAQAECTQLDPA